MCKCVYIMQAPSRSSWKAYSTESSPGGLKGRSNGLNRTRKSLSPIPRFSSSSIRSSDIRRLSTPPPSTRLLPGSPDVHSNNGEIFFKKYSEYFLKKKESQYTYIYMGIFTEILIWSGAGLGKDVPNPSPGSAGSQQLDEFEPDLSLENYPYEQLTVQSSNPAPDIDITRREVSSLAILD